ncbi:hypothetical protein ACXDF8_03520 [Mycolicibacterium sp. CBM1]
MRLLVVQICALAGQVAAVWLARRSHGYEGELTNLVSLAVVFGSALWVLTAPELTRAARNTAVACLGITPTLMWRATNPLLFTGFDEQLHMRTLGDILSSHRLFEANPLLQVSPRYPGIETLTVLVHQTGIPTMASAVIVILVARLVLVAVLCDAVEQLTGSMRAGGLAVAIYALSPQFVFFNNQFAYQTLALPLALAAVSLIARARHSDDPLPLFGGATVCLLAVAMTHHVTSLLTAVFLLVWTLAERGQGRLRVAYGALAAIAAALAWAIVQRSLLEDYFGPIIDDVTGQVSGGETRKTFQDSAGTITPRLDTALLLYYAAAVSMLVLALGLLALHWWRRGERHMLKWGPHFLILLLAGMIPIMMAARVVPKGGELFDRGSSFLFLPLSLAAARFAVRLWWPQPGQPALQDESRTIVVRLRALMLTALRAVGLDRRPRVARLLAVALASGIFLGGYVLGSGPFWARLPGSFLPAADTRSMDAEVLAAARWARQNLPAGSRIGADRVGSELLASQAGVWPVMKANGVTVPPLYFADDFGLTEKDTVRGLRLRFLYVDRRLADGLPRFKFYFEDGEPGDGRVKLTDSQLTKFDAVPGIELVYRHGPISIYDMKKLGVPEQRNGWYGPTPRVSVVAQLALGSVCGLSLALLARSRIWPRAVGAARRLRRVAGPALTVAVAVAGAAVLSAALILCRVWLTPLTWLAVVTVVMMANPITTARRVRRGAEWLTWQGFRTVAPLVIALAIIIGAAAYDAARINIIGVREVLNDPSAIQISPN